MTARKGQSDQSKTGKGRQPGDLTREEMLERIIRVDHAGEYGAVRIYEGQYAVLKNSDEAETIQHMKEQEVVHRYSIEEIIAARGV